MWEDPLRKLVQMCEVDSSVLGAGGGVSLAGDEVFTVKKVDVIAAFACVGRGQLRVHHHAHVAQFPP
jgi:hypothetical protein